MDLADRKIIGYSLSTHLTAQATVIAAWNHARQYRAITPGFIFHSDRGVQYASHQFTRIIQHNTLAQSSMSRKANCWDNATAESFFKTIKMELINPIQFENQRHLKTEIFEYIQWYNNKRIHQSLGYLTPNEMEKVLNPNIKKVA